MGGSGGEDGEGECRGVTGRGRRRRRRRRLAVRNKREGGGGEKSKKVWAVSGCDKKLIVMGFFNCF